MKFTLSVSVLWTLLILGQSAPAAAQKKEDEVPKPKSMTLETSDGVQLRCTWYGGTEGKQSVPIIMLHGWDGVRGEYSKLASYLQEERGCAVIVPDLRGHGSSKNRIVRNETIEIVRERMSKSDIAAIINDIEAAKKFLMEKNNQGELNIEMLCVVAAEELSVVAMGWAVRDWSWPQLIGRKQGQDVKALILLSPKRAYKGLTATGAMKHPLLIGRGAPFTLSVMVLAGTRDSRVYRDAKSIYSSLDRTRPKVPKDLSRRDLYQQKNLIMETADVELQGTKLVDPALRLNRRIRDFIRYQIEERDGQFAWTDRSRQ